MWGGPKVGISVGVGNKFNHGNGIDARVQNRHILFAERKWSADTVAAQLLKFLTATRWIYYIVASYM